MFEWLAPVERKEQLSFPGARVSLIVFLIYKLFYIHLRS